MSTQSSSTGQVSRLNLPSVSNKKDDSFIDTTSSRSGSFIDTTSSLSDSDLEGNDTSDDESTSGSANEKINNFSEDNVKPFCPSSVTHIVNALSAVGTFGGLALIITGGMGMTLNKPVDNAMENIAMVLSGGALMVGSWIGNVAYASHQPA